MSVESETTLQLFWKNIYKAIKTFYKTDFAWCEVTALINEVWKNLSLQFVQDFPGYEKVGEESEAIQNAIQC